MDTIENKVKKSLLEQLCRDCIEKLHIQDGLSPDCEGFECVVYAKRKDFEENQKIANIDMIVKDKVYPFMVGGLESYEKVFGK